MSKSDILGYVCLFAAAITLLTGCDFMRKMAGRPTSVEIEAKRIVIEGERAREEAAAQRNVEDSLATDDDSLDVAVMAALSGAEVAAAETVVDFPDNVKHAKKRVVAVESGYYIILGSFGKEENARNLADFVQRSGFPATLIPIREGYTAVGICHSNDLGEILASLERALQKSFCPADAWILENFAQ